MFGDTTVPSLVSSNWKERLETMTFIQEKVRHMPSMSWRMKICYTRLCWPSGQPV